MTKMKSPEKFRRVNPIRLDPMMFEQLKKAANTDQRSMAGFIRVAIREKLDRTLYLKKLDQII